MALCYRGVGGGVQIFFKKLDGMKKLQQDWVFMTLMLWGQKWEEMNTKFIHGQNMDTS